MQCKHHPVPEQMRLVTGLFPPVTLGRCLAHIISFQAKLDAGVRLNQHMVSYGDRPNDYDSISNCASLSAWFPALISFPFRL